MSRDDLAIKIMQNSLRDQCFIQEGEELFLGGAGGGWQMHSLRPNAGGEQALPLDKYLTIFNIASEKS
jgi:hypothetical protein